MSDAEMVRFLRTQLDEDEQATQDESRVLDIQSKRRIVATCADVLENPSGDGDDEVLASRVLLELITLYRNRPGFNHWWLT